MTAHLKTAKWIKIPLLVDLPEWQELFESYAPGCKLYNVQGCVAKGEGVYSPQEFLAHYGRYIAALKEGSLPDLQEARPLFSAAWSLEEAAIYRMEVEGGELLRPSQPIVQSQINRLSYSTHEATLRTQVFGNDGIYWGIQLGFPHLLLDPDTHEAGKTDQFPNSALFKAIQRWSRAATLPTAFVIQGTRVMTSIRLGKSCFSWIHQHPQLKLYQLEVR